MATLPYRTFGYEIKSVLTPSYKMDTQAEEESYKSPAVNIVMEATSLDGVAIFHPVVPNVGNAIANFITGSEIEEEGNSESEYIDATQMVDLVPETQIDDAHKKQIIDFLQDS